MKMGCDSKEVVARHTLILFSTPGFLEIPGGRAH
jgi:hypothetical protein